MPTSPLVSARSELPLCCPVCGQDLTITMRGPGRPSAASCAEGHRFDAAKQGHINLLTGEGTKFTPDTRDMVASRVRFLNEGHYQPIAQALGDAVARHLDAGPEVANPLIVDAGCGTGYYLNQVMRRVAEHARGIGFDISSPAAQRAAQVPGVTALVWDIWRPWPLNDHSVEAVLNVFAPRNWDESARVLKPGGVLATVTPRPGHLAEIRDAAGLLDIQGGKYQRLREQASSSFAIAGEQSINVALRLSLQQIAALAHMGPAGHHHGPEAIAQRLGTLLAHESHINVTACIDLTIFRKKTALST